MEKWILENMKDCLIYGFSFKWFIDSRDYYLENYSIEELRNAWNKQVNTLSKI